GWHLWDLETGESTTLPSLGRMRPVIAANGLVVEVHDNFHDLLASATSRSQMEAVLATRPSLFADRSYTAVVSRLSDNTGITSFPLDGQMGRVYPSPSCR